MIKETKTNFKIVEKEEKEVLKVEKNNTKINIYDKELVSNMIDKKFKKKYKEVLLLLSDDAGEEDTENIILKIDYLKRLIIEKYYRYLPKSYINKYLKMISILESRVSILERKGRGR